MAANGTIRATERVRDENGRILKVNHKFRGVASPEVDQVTRGIKGQAPAQPPEPPTKKRTRPRGLFG